MSSVCSRLGLNAQQEHGDGGGMAKPPPSFTIAQAAAYLNRGGASWSDPLGTAANLSFSFANTEVNADQEGYENFSRFSSEQMAAAKLALQAWSDVANIGFNQLKGAGPGGQYSDQGAVRFANYDEPGDGALAWGYPPDSGDRRAASNEGDVWVNLAFDAATDPDLWTLGAYTLIHETGHAIGFIHPSDFSGNPGGTYETEADFAQDTRQYTVMSSFAELETGGDFEGGLPSAPQIIDIAGAQRLYGANLTFNAGDTTYGFNSNAGRGWYQATLEQSPIFSAWDAAGEDTFDFSGYGTKQTIDLRNGYFSSVGGFRNNVSVSLGLKVDNVVVNTIENAIGGSNADSIIGNKDNNTLEGRDGNDTLQSGKGDDVLLGGDGNDQLVASKGLDTLNGGLGQDLMTGQKHADRFVFGSLDDSMVGVEDRIYGGLEAADRIDLSGIDADTTNGGNQEFHYGGAAFDGEAGELIRTFHAGSNTTYARGDVDGDGDADFSLAITGAYATWGGFIL